MFWFSPSISNLLRSPTLVAYVLKVTLLRTLLRDLKCLKAQIKFYNIRSNCKNQDRPPYALKKRYLTFQK